MGFVDPRCRGATIQGVLCLVLALTAVAWRSHAVLANDAGDHETGWDWRSLSCWLEHFRRTNRVE
jgi:hypothetical protein